MSITVQNIAGEVHSFLLPEESEIEVLKTLIAEHYEVYVHQVVLSRKSVEEDTFIVCKDYQEVDDDMTYYLFINSLPSYRLVVEEGVLQFIHPSGENPSPNGAHQHHKYWNRTYSPDSPYEIQVHLTEENGPLLVEHLRVYYETMPLNESSMFFHENQDEVIAHRTQMELLLQKLEENRIHVPYLTQEFITAYICSALSRMGCDFPYTLTYHP